MSSKRDDHISVFHSNGLFIPRRTVEIMCEIDDSVAREVIKNLHILDYTQGTISILINTEGGCYRSAMAIYDAIKGCRNYVRAMCYGSCMSSGTILLQAADERLSSPNCKYMIHYGQPGLPDERAEIVDKWHTLDKKDRVDMEDLYLEKIRQKKHRYSRKDLQKRLNTDTIWSAEEALNWGLIDKVVIHYE